MPSYVKEQTPYISLKNRPKAAVTAEEIMMASFGK